MKRAYRFMLLLYPRGHLNQFSEEMTSVFEEAFADRRAQGWSWSVRFAVEEMAGLIGGAAEAWLAPKPGPEVQTASTPNLPQELIDAQRGVDANIAGMVYAIANHQFERARDHSNQERQARERLRILREKYGLGNYLPAAV
jgi:hypothetical protein